MRPETKARRLFEKIQNEPYALLAALKRMLTDELEARQKYPNLVTFRIRDAARFKREDARVKANAMELRRLRAKHARQFNKLIRREPQ